MSLRNRLDKLKQSARECPTSALLDVVVLCPVAEAGGRPPGLYRDGSEGSTVGVFVYDPAAGEPIIPPAHLSPWGFVIGGEARPLDD